MSLVLPGETVYVDGVEVGIVNVRPPNGVDCALRIRLVPPVFVPVTFHVDLGGGPRPSDPTPAALWRGNDTPPAERPAPTRELTRPGPRGCDFWAGGALGRAKAC